MRTQSRSNNRLQRSALSAATEAAGDALLRTLATRVRDAVRRSDSVSLRSGTPWPSRKICCRPPTRRYTPPNGRGARVWRAMMFNRIAGDGLTSPCSRPATPAAEAWSLGGTLDSMLITQG